MKSSRVHGLILTGACACGVCIAIASARGTVPQPGMTISVTNGNQLFVQITNGVSTVNYELYRTVALDPLYPWTLHIIGTQGQTNFVADMGIQTQGFLQTAIGSDWDQDGVANLNDADPSNPAVGILTLTIQSPADGTVFN